MYCDLSAVYLSGGYSSSNSASTGGFVHLQSCSMILDRYDYTISNNTAASDGGAIYADRFSHIKFYSPVTLTGNIAEGNGGAMFINNSNASIRLRERRNEETDEVFVTFSAAMKLTTKEEPSMSKTATATGNHQIKVYASSMYNQPIRNISALLTTQQLMVQCYMEGCWIGVW